ncbi:MAG: hypothetical protein L7V86_10570 [Verrucomicrobiales bacterium]|nr:hypothetical protein [Verrucomicrobiales bacterium]
MKLENTNLETSTSSDEGSNHNLTPERSLVQAADGQLERLKTDSTSGNTGITAFISADDEHPTGEELQRQKTRAASMFKTEKGTADALKPNTLTWSLHPDAIPKERISQIIKYLVENPKVAEGATYEAEWREEVFKEVKRIENAEAELPIANAAANGIVLGVYCDPKGKYTLEIEKGSGERRRLKSSRTGNPKKLH